MNVSHGRANKDSDIEAIHITTSQVTSMNSGNMYDFNVTVELCVRNIVNDFLNRGSLSDWKVAEQLALRLYCYIRPNSDDMTRIFSRPDVLTHML